MRLPVIPSANLGAAERYPKGRPLSLSEHWSGWSALTTHNFPKMLRSRMPTHILEAKEAFHESKAGRISSLRRPDQKGDPATAPGLQGIVNKLHSPTMTKTSKNPKVDGFLTEAEQWREEFEKLRKIILDCGLTEELKWGKPCYRLQESNVVLIHGFKDYCALLFMKGALLKDDRGILVQQTENVQAARQIRFTNVQEIVNLEPVLKGFVQQAIEVEKAGLQVDYKRTAEFKLPEELRNKLKKNPALKKAFAALTPGRQRGYLLYFSAAKQSQTRESRIEKCMPQILDGKGLND
jgi:uncharacterized protein YdeI (YjbR/CyaY-like superfamily)